MKRGRATLRQLGDRLAAAPGRAAVLVVMVVLTGFAMANARFGHHPTDDGFILGYAWRVAHAAEAPYRHFIYARPPLSAYLHTIWFAFPERHELIAARYGVYLQLTVAGLAIGAPMLRRFGPRDRMQAVAAAGLLITGIVWAIHNFPPMPWHTIDGVFWSSLAVGATLVLARREQDGEGRRWHLALGAGLFASAAALSKQNFAGIPLLALALVLVAGRRRRFWAPVVVSLVAIGVSAAIFVGAMLAVDAWPQFTSQLFDVSRSEALVVIGFDTYVDAARGRGGFLAAGMLMGVLDLGGRASTRAGATLWAQRLRLGITLLVLAIVAAKATTAPKNGAFDLWFLLLAQPVVLLPGLVILRRRIDGSSRRWLELGGMGSMAIAAIGWSASISFGYRSPVLGLGAGCLLLALPLLEPTPVSASEESQRDGRGGAPAAKLLTAGSSLVLAALAVASMQSLNEAHPYRQPERAQLTRSLGEIFPAYGPIMADERVYQRLSRLKRGYERARQEAEPEAIAILPEAPIASYLFRKRSPLPIDWVTAVEIQGQESHILADLTLEATVALVEVQGGGCRLPLRRTLVTVFLVHRWPAEVFEPGLCLFRNPAKTDAVYLDITQREKRRQQILEQRRERKKQKAAAAAASASASASAAASASAPPVPSGAK